MIHSSLVADGIMLHDFIGKLDFEELTAAAAKTKLAKPKGVVWDLLQADIAEVTYADAQQIEQNIRHLELDLPDTRRAFVINEDEQQDIVSMVVGHLPTDWRWKFFASRDDAIAWVREA